MLKSLLAVGNDIGVGGYRRCEAAELLRETVLGDTMLESKTQDKWVQPIGELLGETFKRLLSGCGVAGRRDHTGAAKVAERQSG